MADDAAPTDLGAPISFLVLADGTAVYDPGGDRVGRVTHVLSDEREQVFHGLLVDTGAGPRYAAPGQVAGLYERGAVLSAPAADLVEPGEDAVAAAAGRDGSLAEGLRRAWHKLVDPR